MARGTFIPTVLAVVAVLLVLSLTSDAVAGMSQGGLLFRSKSAAPYGDEQSAPSMGAPGGAPATGGAPQQQNMQWYGESNAAAAAFRPTPVPISRESTKIELSLVAKYGDEEDKELRRYEATFAGTYVIGSTKKLKPNATAKQRKQALLEIILFFPFPGSADTVPEASLKVNGKEPEQVKYTQGGVSCELTFKPEEKKTITVSYRAFGTEDFVYMLEHEERIKTIEYTATIKGTQRPPKLPAKECLQPTMPLKRQADTYSVAWTYQDLLTKRDIIIQVPAPIVGSDIAQRMPNLMRTGIVSLILFGLLLLSGGLIVDKRLTLGQFVLVSLPIVVFYPLLLQLSKYMTVYLAFAVAFVLMSALVMANLRRNQGRRFAWTYGLFGLVTVVGMFSAAALLTKGAGTLVTIAAFILVAYVVYATPKLPAMLAPRRPARVQPPPPPVPSAPAEGESPAEDADAQPAAPATAAVPAKPVVASAEPQAFCAHCGRAVEDAFAYCPGCGKEAHVTSQCSVCGADLCENCAAEWRHCPGCGRALPDA